MDGIFSTLAMIVPMIAIFYFLLWRPEQIKRKKRQNMLNNLSDEDKRLLITIEHGTKNTQMALTGAILVVVAIVVLVARDSIVDPMIEEATETFWLRSMSAGQSKAKEAELIRDIIHYGSYGAGAVGLILIAVGLIGHVQQTSASTTAQTSTHTQSHQAATTSEASIPKQIEQLAKLKEQGILSEAEFEEKKKELLARL